MSRFDMAGLFWDDTPPPKVKKEKIKRNPPPRFWEDDNYLPFLDIARNSLIPTFSDEGLINAQRNQETLIFDIECYPNYFLVAFKSIESNKIVYFELSDDFGLELQIPKLEWVLRNFKIVSFNGNGYDMPMNAAALAGFTNRKLKHLTNLLIEEGLWPSRALKEVKVRALENINHIDIMEVAPLSASLKIYGGRANSKRMQDLPFSPDTRLNKDQMTIVRWYCCIDLDSTITLFNALEKDLKLREELSFDYGIDLRSKSNAQIAEAVIGAELRKLTGRKATKPKIDPGTTYYYNPPAYLNFQSELMQYTLNLIRATPFVVGENGSVSLPEAMKVFKFTINNSTYNIGIGGLHSQEKCASHVEDEDTILLDRDVASYYPFIILNLGLYPEHLGNAFLTVYRILVERRLRAKALGDKKVAGSLKIVINGSFGKLGSKYSIFYSPNLLIQVTITGQLTLLLLIERLELAGIPVVSANTDGIVIKCPKARKNDLDSIVKQWEQDTQFDTEETNYSALYSRDVNNYLAIKTDGEVKEKGAYSKPDLFKNPTNPICTTAVKEYLTKGTDIAQTICGCTDITQFLTVRKVTGGAVEATRYPDPEAVTYEFKKYMLEREGWQDFYGSWIKKEWVEQKLPYDRMAVETDVAYRQIDATEFGEYLGKAIRWYYSIEKTTDNELVYAGSGNKVPNSEGAKAMMEMPESFPEDIDYTWYINEAYRILEDIGAIEDKTQYLLECA